MNPVTIICPYCGHRGERTYIDYKPMAILTNRTCFEDSDGNQLARAGTVHCENCNDSFMYRLEVEVICEVAAMPDFYNPDREVTEAELQVAVSRLPSRFGEEL